MSNVVDIYDNNSNIWSTATLSQSRGSLGATSVGGKVIFAGGETSTGVSNIVDIYNVAPSITSFNPTSGAPGNVVMLTGTNFDPEPGNNSVYFNGTAGSVTASSSTSLTTVVPPGASTGPVSVTTNGFTAVSLGNFTVPLPNVITYDALPSKTYGDAPFNLTASASSGLPVSYTSSDSSVATVSDPENDNIWTVNVIGGGTCTITASQSGNASYAAAQDVTQTLTVNRASQTISFSSIPSQTFYIGSLALTAMASSGLTVSYTSSDPAVATIDGNIATFTGVGTTSITASQPGNENYLPATDVLQGLTVDKGNQTTTFNALAKVNSWDPDFNLTATASSGLAVTYTSSDPSVATVSDLDGDNIWTIDIIASGITNITASQSGNSLWNAASPVPQPLVVKATQTITFGPLPDKFYGDAPFQLTAAASSGLTVTYTSSDPSVATVSGDMVTIVAPGITNITASQAGDDNYSPAPDVFQALSIGLLPPTVSASFIEFSNVTDTGMTIGFVPGDGNRHLVVIKPSSPDNFFTPTHNTFYTAGYTSNGSQVIMSGSGLSETVTGLTAGTKYYVKVFEFNENGSYTSYLTDCAAKAAQQTSNSGGGSGARSATSSTTKTEKKDSESKETELKDFDVQIFGNPFDKTLTFKVQSSEHRDASISLTDLSGKVILSSEVKTNSVVEIQKPMPSSIYLLRVSAGSHYKIVRLVKTD